jgi:hypothetical protein
MRDSMVEFFLIGIFLCLGFGDAFGHHLLKTFAMAGILAVYKRLGNNRSGDS